MTFVVAAASWLIAQEYGRVAEPHPRQDEMLSAAQKAEEAFAVVDSAKRASGLGFPKDSPLPWAALLGEDYTPITSTLGSRAAKDVSTNPAWASVLVRMLSVCGVAEGDTVAVLVSASFPALGLSTLAAIHELGAVPLIVASLGASSYGANVRGGTWLDWERWVRGAGVLDVRSVLVTPGGEQDAAIGLPPEGSVWLYEAAQRNRADLKDYASLDDAIAARMTMLDQHRIRAVVNIGGGHASLGACRHAASLPVGLWETAPECRCTDRGALTHTAQRDIPVIHLLQLRQLAALYGLDLEPGSRYTNKANITMTVRVSETWVFAALSAILICVVMPKRRPA
jgi:poly-gamma-glutamate system protein